MEEDIKIGVVVRKTYGRDKEYTDKKSNKESDEGIYLIDENAHKKFIDNMFSIFEK